MLSGSCVCVPMGDPAIADCAEYSLRNELYYDTIFCKFEHFTTSIYFCTAGTNDAFSLSLPICTGREILRLLVTVGALYPKYKSLAPAMSAR